MTPPRKEIEDLKAAVDLVALFQAFGVQVRKQGRGCKALCPFHDETTPSLSIDPKKGLYKCFGCGKAGDSLTFLQEHGKLWPNYAATPAPNQRKQNQPPSRKKKNRSPTNSWNGS